MAPIQSPRTQLANLLKLKASTIAQDNRGLQAAYDELAIADAERVGQSLPPNPTFSWRRIQAGPALESEMQLVTNIIALATLPARSEIAAERFHQAQLRAAEETLRVAHEARRAYYRAVAARELIHFLTESQSAAEAATTMRMIQSAKLTVLSR